MAFTNIIQSNLCRLAVKVPATFGVSTGNGSCRFKSTKRVSFYSLDQSYRQEKRLPQNPNANGPLTDGPDFSYLDGRSAPPGLRQLSKMIRQQQLARDVVRLSGEIDFAVERHKKLQVEKEEERQRILDSKLKPKGKNLLLKK